eukprot:jgi/Mesen1/9381/ME000610S08682
MADQRNGSGKDGGLQIDLNTYSKRLKAFYTAWRQDQTGSWQDVNAVAIAVPPTPDEDMRYLKSSALHIWLIGYEFPETIMVFAKNCIHVLCSQKKANILEEVRKNSKTLTGIDMKLHVKTKQETGATQMEKLVEIMKEAEGGAKLGLLTKEAAEGQLLEKWAEVLDQAGLETADITGALTELLAVKDESEITNIKKAAHLSSTVLKLYVVSKLEEVIDDEKKVTHAKLMEDTEAVILEPAKIKVKLKAENCDLAYPPVLQSGGKFDLKASAGSSDDELFYDTMGVIICALGARYASYCSNVARTYLIDASAVQEKAYKVLLRAHEAAIAALKPGNKLCDAYKGAVACLEREGPELLPYLTRNAGTGIGLEFREAGLTLNAKNEHEVRAGMAFNVSLGLQGLPNEKGSSPETREFAILLADTVVVKDEKAEVTTHAASKAFSDVAYSFKVTPHPHSLSRSPSASSVPCTIHSAFSRDETKEEKRRKHQAELAQQKIEETARRLAAGGLGTGEADGPKRSTGELNAYRTADEIPVSRELMIEVDTRHEAVLLPIYGLLVPFHISTIKTVSSQQDGGHSYIRIIFNVPAAGYSPNDVPMQKFPDAIYVKEVSFRSSDVKHSNQVVQMIKTISRQVRQRESERAERATLVTQERLTLSKGKPIRLGDLWIRPAYGGRGRKLTGTLEAHANGFRYSTSRQEERVDVMFRNIKHAFFQPAENEMVTLLHFHLHNPIMVGNKKTKDVQFFAEVMEVVQTVGAKRSAFDPDEIEEEQRERERRNKINKEFEMFVRRVHEVWEKDHKDLDLEFDVPFRELGFHGVPYKSSAFIVPSVNCLVELIETPFMVISLSDIEIVSLERVGLGQKTLDMAIVFKDFKRDVMRIDAIPSTSLDSIKEWLNQMNIKYYESRLNLNWKPILKEITDNPKKFVEEGGWEFLNIEGSDSDSDGSGEEDAYEPSDVEEASESEEEDEDDESVVDSEEEDEEDEEEEEEEEGLTWDELEERARKEDKEHGEESDSDGERRRHKSKGGGGGGGGGGAGSSRPSDSRARPGGGGGGGDPRGRIPPSSAKRPMSSSFAKRPAPPPAKKVRR